MDGMGLGLEHIHAPRVYRKVGSIFAFKNGIPLSTSATAVRFGFRLVLL